MKHSHIQTVGSDFFHWNASLERHKAEYSENDESTENARTTVDDCSNDRISEM